MENNQSRINFVPFGKRIVVKRHKPDAGGLKLTEEMEKESSPSIGEILQVGQIGFWNKWIKGIRPGRIVHFARYSPVKIATVDYEFIYVELENILGIESSK